MWIAEQNLTSTSKPKSTLDLERLTRWLAGCVDIKYIKIDPLKIDVSAVTNVIKHSYASRFNILPIAVNGKKVTVATAEPFVHEWERELSQLLKLEFDRVIANPLSVARYLAEFYAISKSISRAEVDRSATPVSTAGNLEQLLELGKTGEFDANDQHIVRIVDWLLQYAFDQRASDIHLEPRRETGNIRFRIDSILHLVNQIPTPVLSAVISRVKALGRMDVIERRRPQDGRIKTKMTNGKEVELRLSTMPSTFGEKMVMRIFDPDVLLKSLTDLGFSSHDRNQWVRMAGQPHGTIIVTGPTGSGKTTTLYSTLKHLARPELNICTIEDPIELVDPIFNQMQVQHNIGIGFASGVRTLLRQDPDIIMIGEIRDSETAETAIQAALTGHLVLTTLHTNDAPSTIIRLLDLGVAPYLIRSSLLGVVAQRLVRTLCPHCRTAGEISADEWRSLVAPMRLRRPTKAFVPGWLRRMPLHRVFRSHRYLRDSADDPEYAQSRDRRCGHGDSARNGHQRRHAAAAYQWRTKGAKWPDLRCGGVQRGPGRGGIAVARDSYAKVTNAVLSGQPPTPLEGGGAGRGGWEKLPRPAHAPYLHPCRQSVAIGVVATAEYCKPLQTSPADDGPHGVDAIAPVPRGCKFG